MAQVSYGTITITDNNDIEKIYMEYAQSTSNQTAPTSASDWSTDIPAWQQGKYIWQRTVTKMSGVALSSDSYGEPVCLTGSTGSTGATGRSVDSIVTTYCNYGDGTPADNYSGWQSTVPAYDNTKPNYWVKTVITYSNPTETSTTKYKDNGITSATSTAAAANSTAQAANNTANQANTTAGEAKTIAEGASSAISDLNQYFWRQKTAATNVPAGSYVTNIPGTTYKNNPASGGFNSLVQASGIFLRNGITTLSSWTGDALTFNNPSTGNAQLIIGANGTLQSGNYQRGSNSKFASFGTKIDLVKGDIITQYFRLSQGLESGVNAGAYIHGTIEAVDGKIGSDSNNYWDIGNYTDYNLHDSAKIIGHGSSFIQLGDTSTWRLATNRIHTGWYESNDSYLHFLTFSDGTNNKRWDYGIHVPTSKADKFLYIRNASATTDASNLIRDLEDTQSPAVWTYKFWVDGEGNVHAPGFYIGNSTTPIGGGAGTVAERLTQGYGSVTQPIYFNSDGIPTVTNLDSVYLSLTGGTITGPVVFGDSVNIDELTTGDLTVNGAASFTNNLQVNTINGVEVGNQPKFTDTVTTVTTTGNGNAITAISATNGAITATKGVTFLTSYTETDPTVPDWAKTPTKPSYALSEITDADDIKAIEALTGTKGFLKKTATNTWTLDTSTYLTGITSNDVTTALGYTPYNSTNPNGYITASHTSTYSLPTAKYNVLGGVKPAYNSTNAVTLTTAAAANTNAPTIAAKTTTSDRYYAVEIDKNGVLFVNVPWTNVNSSYLTRITSNDVTTALGYTPYNSTNPNGYTTNTGTVTSVRVQASNPLQSSTSTASSTTLNTTISFINQDANKVLAGPSSGDAAAPTFRKLVATDIPNLSWNKITTDKPTTLSGYGITDAAGLTAITGVSITDAQLTITRANGTSTTTDVTITASQATGATKLINSQGQDAAAGSETLPVYFTGGYPQAVTSIAKLNGAATTYPQFYAPTSGGTASQVLVSQGNAAPQWVNQSEISSGNTYTTTIATDSGTNQLTLAHGTKYKLTAGGTSFIFTMPTDTDKKLEVGAVTSGTTYYPIVGTGDAAATRQYDITGFVYVSTNGTANGSNGNALLTLGNSTASTTANWKKGTVRLYGTTAYYIDIISGAPSGNRTITLPNKTGTVALTSDIPTVPTVTGNSTTGITIANHNTTTITGVSGSTTASKVTVGSHATDYGVKTSGSFTQGTDSFTANVPTKIDTTKFNGGSYSHTGFNGGSYSHAGFSGGSLMMAVDGTDSKQLNITFTAAIYGTDTFTAATYGTDTFTAASLGSGFYTAGSAAKFTQGTDTYTAPTLGSKIPTVSASDVTVPKAATSSTTVVTSATHSITDNGHTHSI